MACRTCGATARAAQHRSAVRQTARPYPWPAEIAAIVRGAVRELRRANLQARAWLTTQALGPQRFASQRELDWLHGIALQAEQRLLRVGSDG